MTISQRLYSAVGGLTVAGLLLAGVSSWNLATLGDELDVAINKEAVKLDLINSIRARSFEMVAEMRATYLWSHLKNDNRVESAISDWRQARKRTDELVKDLRPLLVTEEGRALLAQIEAQIADYDKVATEYMKFAKQREFSKVGELAPMAGAAANELEKIGVDFRSLQLRLLKAADGRSDTLRSQSIWFNLILVGLLMAAAGFAVFGVRGVNKALRQTIHDLSEGGEQVASASSQIASTSQSLSQGASEQAASLEEISASMEEMTAMAKRNSENSGEATGMMGETASQVERSNVALQEMVHSMSAIKASSEKVAKIIKTIDEIAFQTNILALNAAVEAARAGEAGMGFAVVADEVRNLAQRSAVAAKDTASLIEEAISNSNLGAEKLEMVASSIRGITESAGKVRNLVDEVSESSKQQTVGINQTATAVTQVSQVTQTAAASAEESAAAAEELSAQSQNIRDLVRSLRAMVESNHDAARPHPSVSMPRSVPVRNHASVVALPSKAFALAPRKAQAPAVSSHHSALPPQTSEPAVPKQPVHATVAAAHDPFPMDAPSSGDFKSF